MFTEKQKVWCAIYGAGVVEEINQECGVTYPILVKFKDLSLDYTSDGRVYAGGNITLFPHPVEIVKATAVKPSIDWTQIKDEYKWLAVDANECAYVYENEPNIDGSAYWCSSSATYFHVNGLVSYSRGTCDWKDSLVERPD